MYHEILPPCTHAQKEITCSNASLHPSEQFYMHKKRTCLKRALKVLWKLCTTKFYHLAQAVKVWTFCIRTLKKVFIVWELKECLVSCLKSSESAGSAQMYHEILPPCTRRRRSPVPMQVYIPVNSSICIRTLKKVYSSCESWKSCLVSCLKRALKVLWKCADVPRNSTTLHTCAEGDHLFQCKFTSQWTVLYA